MTTTCKNCGHEIKKGNFDVNRWFHVYSTVRNVVVCGIESMGRNCGCTNPEPIIILLESRKAKAEHSKAIIDEAGFNNSEPKDAIKTIQ